MSNNIVPLPNLDLMAEAEKERAIVETPEAKALKEAIFKAMQAYMAYLEKHGFVRTTRITRS
jgi:hypothetical protein